MAVFVNRETERGTERAKALIESILCGVCDEVYGDSVTKDSMSSFMARL
jgi:hypothetical protein